MNDSSTFIFFLEYVHAGKKKIIMSSSPKAGDSDYDPELSDYEDDIEEFVEIDMRPIKLEYVNMMKESGDPDWEKKVKKMNRLKKKRNETKKRRKKKKKKRKRNYSSDDDYVPKRPKRKKRKRK
jgi:hypothetical protein